MIVFCDLETRSPTPITAGAYRYSERAEVLLWSYALGRDPVQLWDVASGAPMPDDLRDALADDSVPLVWANGDLFDRVVLRAALGIDLPLHRIEDTKQLAYSHGLPGGLAALCQIYKIADAKTDGRKFISLFCKPQADGCYRDATTHPTEWALFGDYARRDVSAMREIYYKLPRWNDTPTERAAWHADLRVNDRGFCVDIALAAAAVRAVDIFQRDARKQSGALTGGAVESVTQRDALLKHLLDEYLIDLPDLTASTIERRLADERLDEGLRELLRLRLAATTTSTTKYKTLLRGVSADSRLRGCVQFRGAMRTGRAAHRLFQPGNLPRPTVPAAEIDDGIEALKLDALAYISTDVMAVASSALRGCIIAAHGKKLVVADYASIEARALAWLAGEEKTLQAFRDYDAGTGPDIYVSAYANAFNVPAASVTKPQRTLGKVMTLMLGYAGGVGAFVTGAQVSGIDLQAMADSVELPAWAREEAAGFYQWSCDTNRSTYKLPPDIFIACDALKRVWRNANPRVEQLWDSAAHAMRAALAGAGLSHRIGEHLLADRAGNWLRIRLPSGRYLSYPSPRDDAHGLSYLGINAYTKQWERVRTYGGKIIEQVTQAVCADFLYVAIQRAEDAGYLPVMHVHDEPITEAPDTDAYTAQGLVDLMTAPVIWAPGMPLAAAGFETYRYRKE